MSSVRSVPRGYVKDKEDHLSQEIIRGLNLAVVKLTAVQMTKLLLYLKIYKLGMICSIRPLLTEGLCIVQKQEFYALIDRTSRTYVISSVHALSSRKV
jgi:hypothetical protein